MRSLLSFSEGEREEQHWWGWDRVLVWAGDSIGGVGIRVLVWAGDSIGGVGIGYWFGQGIALVELGSGWFGQGRHQHLVGWVLVWQGGDGNGRETALVELR